MRSPTRYLANQKGQTITEYIVVASVLILFGLFGGKTCIELLTEGLNQYLENILYLVSLPIP